MSETPESVRSRDPLIEAALRPLSDNAELHLAAAGFLENLKISDDGEEEAVVRWDAQDGRRRRVFWRRALWVALIVASAAVWLVNSGELFRYFEWGKWSMHPYSGSMPDSEERVGRRLDAKQKLLLFGDQASDHQDERKEGLWLSEPDHPAYFAEYAVAYAAERSELPPEFLETARRIDPDNAWFTYFAGGVWAREAVKSKPQTAKGEHPPEWEILDQARMDRALELFHEARMQGSCDDYTARMLLERLALLPQGTLIEGSDSIACIANATVFGSLRIMHLMTSVAAKAWSLGEAGDAKGFQELSKDMDAYLQGRLDMEVGTLVDELVFTSTLLIISESFAPAAERLGLEAEATRWKKTWERVRARNDARKSWEFTVDGKTEDPRKVTGVFGGGSMGMVSKQVQNPPALADDDLKPGRLIEHEIVAWFSSYVIWLIMGALLGLVVIYRFRVPLMVRRLAGRMEDLLRPVDWTWILGAGVLLPLVFVMAVNRLTPLGGRQFGLAGVSFLLPVGHFLALLVVWLVLPVAIIRWRFAKVAGFFGFSKPSWAPGLAVLGAVALVPVIGWVAISEGLGELSAEWMNDLGLEVEKSGPASLWVWCAIGLLAVPLLWLAITSCRAVFSHAGRLFHRATVSVVLARAYAACMLLVILAVPCFKAAEQYWFERDTLMRFDATLPGWSRYEYQVAVQLRKETREILGD